MTDEQKQHLSKALRKFWDSKEGKKRRKKISKERKEYWDSEEGEKQKQINSEKSTEWWDNKDESEYVLGKRYQQKSHGARCEEGYRAYQLNYQRKYRAERPHFYAWMKQKRQGKTTLDYAEWLVIYEQIKSKKQKELE